MKYLVIVIALILLIVLVIVIIGYLLRVKHSARTAVAINAAPEKVWKRL